MTVGVRYKDDLHIRAAGTGTYFEPKRQRYVLEAVEEGSA